MPLTDSYGQNVPYPTLTDKPNAQTLGQGIVEGLTPKSVMTFPSANVRGAIIRKPVAGMVTWLQDVGFLEVYDGSGWVTVAAGTSRWKKLVLVSGYAGNGNSNGAPQYRIVNLFGERTIMFRGGLSIDYGKSTTAPNDGEFATPLPVGDRPATRRTVTVACSIAGKSDRTSVKLDVNADGRLQLIGVNGSGNNPQWVSLNGTFCSL